MNVTIVLSIFCSEFYRNKRYFLPNIFLSKIGKIIIFTKMYLVKIPCITVKFIENRESTI